MWAAGTSGLRAVSQGVQDAYRGGDSRHQFGLAQRARDVVQHPSELVGPRRAVFLTQPEIASLEIISAKVSTAEGVHEVAILAQRDDPHQPIVLGTRLPEGSGSPFLPSDATFLYAGATIQAGELVDADRPRSQEELDRLMHARARAKSFGNPTPSMPQEFERVGRLIATIDDKGNYAEDFTPAVPFVTSFSGIVGAAATLMPAHGLRQTIASSVRIRVDVGAGAAAALR